MLAAGLNSIGEAILFSLLFTHPLAGCDPKDEHEEHVQRFLDPEKSTYSGARHKAVLTIGSKMAMVKKRVEQMVECMKGKQGGPQIVGLVVSVGSGEAR